MRPVWCEAKESGEQNCQPLYRIWSSPAPPGPPDRPGDLSTHRSPSGLPAGPIPGAAEQGPGHQVDPAAGAGHQDREAEPGAFVRAVHQQPQETIGWYPWGERPPGLGAQEHAGLGGGLQEQVSWGRMETGRVFAPNILYNQTTAYAFPKD